MGKVRMRVSSGLCLLFAALACSQPPTLDGGTEHVLSLQLEDEQAESVEEIGDSVVQILRARLDGMGWSVAEVERDADRVFLRLPASDDGWPSNDKP